MEASSLRPPRDWVESPVGRRRPDTVEEEAGSRKQEAGRGSQENWAAHTCQAGGGHSRARCTRLGALIVGGCWGHSAIGRPILISIGTRTAMSGSMPVPMPVPIRSAVASPVSGARAVDVRGGEVADGRGQGQRRLAGQAGGGLWSRGRHVVEAHGGSGPIESEGGPGLERSLG